MTALEQLETTVENPGLKAVPARLPNLLEQAAKQEPGYTEFLLDVLKTEADARPHTVSTGAVAVGPPALLEGV